MSTKKTKLLETGAAIVAALILLQTLYFKFGAHPDSVYIFSQLGGEPYSRLGSGVLELLTGLLLVVPKTRLYGAILGLGIMMGALGAHLFVLGININHDGGTLFLLALITFVCCALIIFLKKDQLTSLFNPKKK